MMPTIFGGPVGVVDGTLAWISDVLGTDAPATRPATVPKDCVAKALVKMLFADHPVGLAGIALPHSGPGLPPPPDALNLPPPIFAVPLFAILYLQNQFQALIIVACLVTLVGSAPAPPHTSSTAPVDDLSPLDERLWAILQTEIGPSVMPDFMQPSKLQQHATGSPIGEQALAPTRIPHLADEVISHRRAALVASGATLLNEEEARLRASVDRILRYADPVYKLLKGRLQSSIEGTLVEFAMSDSGATGSPGPRSPMSPPGPSSQSPSSQGSAPISLRTGRPRELAPPTLGTSASARLPDLSLVPGRQPRTMHLRAPKGFERPAVLWEKATPILQRWLAENVWQWMEDTWGDVLEWRE